MNKIKGEGLVVDKTKQSIKGKFREDKEENMLVRKGREKRRNGGDR